MRLGTYHQRGLVMEAQLLNRDIGQVREGQRIAIDSDWAAAGTPIRLSAGRSGTADVKTGSRAIIAFLRPPIQRRIDEAGRERR